MYSINFVIGNTYMFIIEYKSCKGFVKQIENNPSFFFRGTCQLEEKFSPWRPVSGIEASCVMLVNRPHKVDISALL